MRHRAFPFVDRFGRTLRCFACTVCFFGGSFLPDTAPAALDWQPRKTWLFAVGVLEWQHSDAWPAMPNAQVNRRDVQLVEHFRTAGVPERQIVFLQDRHATRKKIQQAFAGELSQTRLLCKTMGILLAHSKLAMQMGLTF